MNRTKSLDQLVKESGISLSFLAHKMKMPYGTFKNKLRDDLPQYHFKDHEEKKLRLILSHIAQQLLITN
jgi:hypothetical protein